MVTNASDERGQVGVGTLIIFIALVLVAGIAAGAMLDSAGLLEGKAYRTGERSNERVVDRIDPIAKTGVVGPSDRVETVEFVVRGARHAGPINLTAITIEFLGPDGVDRLSPTESGSELSITALQDDDGSLQGPGMFLDGDADRALIAISLSDLEAAGGANGPMEPGETATVRLSTEGGAMTVVRLSVPSSISDGDRVAL